MRVAPVAYVLALKESKPSYASLVKAAELTYAMCKHPIFDESGHHRVSDIWVDGHLGALAALEELLPTASVHRCMEHVEKNITDEPS